MTFEPAKLDKPGAPLDAEVKSVEILRGRLDGLTPEGSKGGDEKGGDKHERDEGVKRARAALDAYEAWLGDPAGEFRPGDADGETGGDREVLVIIDEVLCRQRYIANQLTLLSLKAKRKPGETRIAKLQAYNEVKDAAQELMGLVAESRDVVVGKLYEGGEFGVSAED